MPRRGSWVWTAALLGALGCAGTEEGAAQEQPPASPEKPKPEPKPGKDGEQKKDDAETLEKEEEGRLYDLVISVKDPEKGFRLVKGALFVPEVSLFGGEGGTASKLVRLKAGPAEVTIPFRRIKKIEVKGDKDDRIEVTILLVPAPGQDKDRIEGSVKAGLELRGTYEGTDFPAVAKLRDLIAVELIPQEKK